MPQASIAHHIIPDQNPGRNYFGLRAAKVVGSDWRDHTIDVIMDDGSTFFHVQIVEMWAGSDYGDLWHPQYTEEFPNSPLALDTNVDSSPGTTDDATFLPTMKRDSYALLAFVEGHMTLPICLGFFYPEVSEMMFDSLQRLTRHVGDTFSAVSNDGNHYISFDSSGNAISFNDGHYIPPYVKQNDFDKRSNPQKGPFNITLYVAATQSRVQLDGKTGDILVETVQGGSVVIKSQGSIEITGGGAVSISGSPLTLSGLVGVYFS